MKPNTLIALICAILVISGCARIPTNKAASHTCDYNKVQGETFTFKETFPGGEKYGYSRWSLSPDTIAESLPYYEYVGKSGKLTPKKFFSSYSKSSFHIKAVLENCQVVYVYVIGDDDNYPGIYLDSQVESANKLIGNTIWIDNSGVIGAQELITNKENVSYTTYNTEPVKVIGISLNSYGYSSGSGPFFLKVEKSNGQVGLMNYNDYYFHTNNPISAETPERIKKAIQQKKIIIGMNEEQVLLSWGEPEDVNRSIGSWGVHEQWVYGSQYLYFENGILSSFQSN